MKHLARAFLALLFAFAAHGAEPSLESRCLDAIRSSLSGEATWTMTRTFVPSGRLVSSGSVSCVALSGIVWRVESPFASSVSMTTNEMVFADDEGVRRKGLDALPHYAEIQKRTDDFVRGDTSAFDGLFSKNLSETAEGAWHLELKPAVSALRHLFVAVEIEGRDRIERVRLKTAEGGASEIAFKERPHAK